MIPILYPADADLSTIGAAGGIGRMTEAVSCTVRYEINGVQECTVAYPVTGARFQALAAGQIIAADTHKGRHALNAFRIYKISRPIGGVVTITARQVCAYDLAGCLCLPFEATGLADAIAKIQTYAVTQLPVALDSYDKQGAFVLDRVASVWEILGMLLATYGGELLTACDSAEIVATMGEDDRGEIRYGANMLTLDHIFDIGDLYSGVLPYWQHEEDGVVTRVYGDVQRASGTYPVDRILSLDASSDFEEQPTAAQLNAYGLAFLSSAGVGLPVENLKVSYVETRNFPAVGYGDTLRVSYPQMRLTAQARLTGGVYNVLADRFDSLTIGASRTSIADTITRQEREISANSAAISGQSAALSAAATRGDVASAITASQAIAAQAVTDGGLTVAVRASGKAVTLEISGSGTAAMPYAPAAAVHCYMATATGTAEISLDALGVLTVVSDGSDLHLTYLMS